MRNKSDDSETLEQLVETAKELNDLIEDNNQNIKDCYRVLQQIQKRVCPKKPSIFRYVISKILNINVVL